MKLNHTPFFTGLAGNLLPIILLGSIAVPVGAAQTGAETMAKKTESKLSEHKQTVLGLYVTSKDAYAMWQAAPDQVKIIDVRTPEEFLYVGHPAMAWKIPFAMQSYEWDAEKKWFPITPVPDFVARIQTMAKPDDTILLMCRSGDRSALAVNQLAKAGFTKAYTVTDGMEGDKVSNPESLFKGQRLVNGWKNSGCPWTYDLTPDRMVLPKASAQ